MKKAARKLGDAVAGEMVQGEEAALLAAAEGLRGELAGLLARAGRGGKMGTALVHDLRVASRRMEEAARLLGVLMEKGAAEEARASLTELRRAAGEVRDVDVTGEHLAARSGKWRLPAALRPLAGKLLEDLGEQRKGAEKKLLALAGAASVMGAMVLLARVIEENSTEQKAAEAQRRMDAELAKQRQRREKAVRKAFGKAARKQTPEALHAARIAAKKLRYVLELAEAGGEKGVKKRIQMLKDVQDLLGDHHDAHVLLGLVEERAESVSGKSAQAGYEKWRGVIERKQAQRAAAFFVHSYAWMNG